MKKLLILLGLIRLMLPESLVALIYLGRRDVVDGRVIDPKAQAAGDLVSLIRDANAPPSVEESRRQISTMAAKFDAPCPRDVIKIDTTMPGAEGDLPARVYVPAGQTPTDAQPTLLFLHGGGWIQGDLDTHDGLCGKLSARSGVRVISLAYRLAPEHPFPAAADDALACYEALSSGRTPFAVTPDMLIVGGDSAGGNLTAGLMHDLVVGGLPVPKGQLLIYPAVDASLTSDSMKALAQQPLLPAKRIDFYLSHYLPPEQDPLTPRVSPLFSDTHDMQPPACIVAGGHDPLWDDAQGYGDKLHAAGVDVTRLNYPGQVHAFMSLTKVIPQGDHAITACADWLKERFSG
ncbi:alpha/beta hydrolase [Shimia biformata]|uniref:alpha/beta hydrolase n=1 Tax=Shimia biformata TaxID=1294299 RepID=UPI001951A256|nr:alpha/beta hydrolase [Shimia biformata]